MADKLTDTLNKVTAKQGDTFKEVTCPSCAAKIRLYAKMDYGYCRFCACKVFLRDARDRKFSTQLIDHLSGEEYYTLMQEGKNAVDMNVAKKAVEKGSLTAAMELGQLFFDKEDFKRAMDYFKIAKDGGDHNATAMYPTAALELGWQSWADDRKTAMKYFKIAKDGGNEEGRLLYVVCNFQILVDSRNVFISDMKKYISELEAINRNKLSARGRDFLESMLSIAKETLRSELSNSQTTSSSSGYISSSGTSNSIYGGMSRTEWNKLNDDLDAVQAAIEQDFGPGYFNDI